MNLTIWHNNSCSTSRNALELLRSKGHKLTIRYYLEDSPTEEELAEALNKMGENPEYIVRKKEKLYQEKYKDKKITPKRWLSILSKNPVLIERPIVISKGKAWLARPFDQWAEEFGGNQNL